MKIDGSKLLIYDGDKPIEVATNAVITFPELTKAGESVEMTGEGTFDFATLQPFDPFEDPEYCKAGLIKKIQSMPRKKKKRIKTLLKKGYTMNVTIR